LLSDGHLEEAMNMTICTKRFAVIQYNFWFFKAAAAKFWNCLILSYNCSL
jgi:hypothetical protein